MEPELVPEALGSPSSEALILRLPLVPEESHTMAALSSALGMGPILAKAYLRA